MTTNTSDIRIWLVEDDESYRQTLSFVVGKTEYFNVEFEFGDCEAAIDAARNGHSADVILLDVNLPGLSGVEGLSTLKRLVPSARIVMLTIIDDAATIFEAFQNGASGYLLKNSSVDKIIAAVREAASGGMLMPAPVAEKVLAHFHRPDREDYGLTSREQDVLEEMGRGYSQKEIADRLFVSPHTVNTHIQHIYDKLHVRSGLEAVAKAFREGLIE
jgi:DNA-binding NarL/FixJ family response regulator